jgi:hypothetical protein
MQNWLRHSPEMLTILQKRVVASQQQKKYIEESNNLLRRLWYNAWKIRVFFRHLSYSRLLKWRGWGLDAFWNIPPQKRRWNAIIVTDPTHDSNHNKLVLLGSGHNLWFAKLYYVLSLLEKYGAVAVAKHFAICTLPNPVLFLGKRFSYRSIPNSWTQSCRVVYFSFADNW